MVADNDPIKKIKLRHNSGNHEWYTPEIYIEAARRVMGSIDLDPASSDIANIHIKAKAYYTIENCGLENKWSGNVWMNPPYNNGLIGKFTDKVIEEYISGNVPQACVLVNNATETKWFQKLLSVFPMICFVQRRIKFIDISGERSGTPLQGQVILYIGTYNKESFKKEFQEFGAVYDG